MPSSSHEVDAIEGAFADQIKQLYKVLVANLVDSGSGAGAEQKSVERFLAGMKVSKRARELALAAVSGSATSGQPNLALVEHGLEFPGMA